MNNILLHTKDLSVGYKKHPPIIVNSNLSIAKGKLIALIGLNGSGKSTLLRTIGGLQKALDGKVLIGEEDIHTIDPNDLAKQISFVLTKVDFSGSLKVIDLISLGRTPYTGWLGTLSKEDKKVLGEVIALTNVQHLLGKSIAEISDGERQKVFIARALAQNTQLLIMDEPTAHLDITNRVEIISLLKQLVHKKNISIVYATHELNNALQMADEIWILDNDKKIHQMLPSDLLNSDLLEQVFCNDKVSFDAKTKTFKFNV